MNTLLPREREEDRPSAASSESVSRSPWEVGYGLLQIGSTVRELDLWDACLDAESAASNAARWLMDEPLLPGIILTDGGHLLGMISRRRFFECLGRPFGVDLFLKRPLRALHEAVLADAMVVPAGITIVDAARRSLDRRPELLYEPVVVETADGAFQLLDSHRLQLAQSQIHEMLTDALRISEGRNRALLDAIPDLMVRINRIGVIVDYKTAKDGVSLGSARSYGGRDIRELLPDAVAHSVVQQVGQALATGASQAFEYRIDLDTHRRVTGDGRGNGDAGSAHDSSTLRYFEARLVVSGDDEVLAIVRDVTERKRIEQALNEEKERAQVTLESIGDAVITTDAGGRVQSLNPVAEKLTAWTTEDARGLPLSQVFRIVNESTRLPASDPVERALREGRIVGLANHTVLLARDGSEFAIDDSAAPIRGRDGRIIGAVLVFRDVTQARSMALQLSWQASHDGLTGLANRRELEQRLDRAMAAAHLQNHQHALCYLDLDRFKVVNDAAGHVAGDELLRQVSALLQSKVRKSDTVARLGGDEFAILLTQCPPDQAVRLAEAAREAVHEFRFVWQGNTFTVGASIGLVCIDSNSENLGAVLSAADAACYTAKNRGRNRVHVYEADDVEVAERQGTSQWVARLTEAIDGGHFRLYHQVIEPLDGRPCGRHFEVLLRLADGTGEVVQPMAFLPAAERYNLMPSVDRWVIRTLFATHGRRCAGCPNSRADSPHACLYTINLSGATLNDDSFVHFLREEFAASQVPPNVICFEITETVAISNLRKAAELIGDLKTLGCRFALDDFGSGMSSLAYLKSLPVDYLKIDGHFVRDIVEDAITCAMVEAINRIGHVMGIQTIAEFVESPAVLRRVQDIGVDYAQGYAIAEPRPLSDCPLYGNT